MKVTLKVIGGSGDGQQIKITREAFAIGRDESCQLRPKSDEIGRRHCELHVANGQVTIRDLGSRTGTFVNDEKIDEPRLLESGDQLRVGPLRFEVEINHELGGQKRPKISGIKDAAARTAQRSAEASAQDDVDIDDMFGDDDEESSAPAQFNLDDIQVVESEEMKEAKKAKAEKAKKKAGKKKQKKVYGKLPTAEEKSAGDTRDAATDMLKKFFRND